MSINLKKGGKINLSKDSGSTLKRLVVGLGWDEVEQPRSRGILGMFKANKAEDIDCDASAILCNEEGKLASGSVLSASNKLNEDVVYYGNLKHFSGCVEHMGDNLTGGGDGDDEKIIIDLANLPTDYNKIVFVVNIYQADQKKQHFGMIRNAFIRIFDANTKKELCKYNLTDNYSGYTAMVFGELVYGDNGWQFNAIGDGTHDSGILYTAQRYV